jgi:hypothetical protein
MNFGQTPHAKGGGEGTNFFFSHCLYRSAWEDTMLLLLSGWPWEVFAMLSLK